MWTPSLRAAAARTNSSSAATIPLCHACRRRFHDYFVTHLPSSSLHPDSRSGPHHKLPRDQSVPHDPKAGRTPAAPPPMVGVTRDTTVVRIPLHSAKHHFGVAVSRGQRLYNEDTYQAGTIEIPAFAKRGPISLTRSKKAAQEGAATSADSASGDPQVFYFGVFDGHGGSECSEFLRGQLHHYVEEGVRRFELHSTLKRKEGEVWMFGQSSLEEKYKPRGDSLVEAGKNVLDAVETNIQEGTEKVKLPDLKKGEKPPSGRDDETEPPESATPVKQSDDKRTAEELEKELVKSWRELVGGYFKRFKPEYFSVDAGGQGHALERDDARGKRQSGSSPDNGAEGTSIETVLEYAFLKADYDFVAAQAGKTEDDPVATDRALNEHDILDNPNRATKEIGGPKRFKGGSTGSIALISTPTPTPFWHPASPSTLLTCHVGDTRILLCNTANGLAIPVTSNHHPSHPLEAQRMRRYAATFVTDSFGEERVQGLANTRAFGDMQSKRIGVSAEPEIRRVEMAPAEYSFIVLVSDGISGPLSDQEIVDIVKEAKTPDQGARDVVAFATEISEEGDNATALVVRLGGWERRIEGGLGSMGTKEIRDWRRQEGLSPRSRRR